MPVEPVPVAPLSRKPPSLVPGDVPFATFNCLRLAWDQIFELREQVTAAQATITRLIAANNALEAEFAKAKQLAEGGLGPRQEA